MPCFTAYTLTFIRSLFKGFLFAVISIFFSSCDHCDRSFEEIIVTFELERQSIQSLYAWGIKDDDIVKDTIFRGFSRNIHLYLSLDEKSEFVISGTYRDQSGETSFIDTLSLYFTPDVIWDEHCEQFDLVYAELDSAFYTGSLLECNGLHCRGR